MYRKFIFPVFILLLASCSLKKDKKEWEKKLEKHRGYEMQTVDSHMAVRQPVSLPKETLPPVKEPLGVYYAYLPQGVQQMVHFKNDHTYLLQETYGKDSMVTTKGSWAPSDGYIWIYKDQVVRGRYRWQGNTLEYYNPSLQKGFPMHLMDDINQNKVWNDRASTGLKFFGIGNEPFWSVEITPKDSILFHRAEEGIITAAARKTSQSGAIIYTSGDSLEVKILPYLCSDGMSDYAYPQSVQVRLHQQSYKGCGKLY